MTAQQQFLAWLARNFPIEARAAQLVAARAGVGWLQSVASIVSSVASVAPAVVNAKAQKRAINLQLEQLRAGLSPLPNEAVGLPAVVPSPPPAVVERVAQQVAAAVDPAPAPGFLGGVNPNVLIIGGGLALALLVVLIATRGRK